MIRLDDANIEKSEFIDVNLSDTTFKDVILKRASFTDASLADSIFDDVDLSNVSIANAKLDGMTIDGILVRALFEAYFLQNPDASNT